MAASGDGLAIGTGKERLLFCARQQYLEVLSDFLVLLAPGTLTLDAGRGCCRILEHRSGLAHTMAPRPVKAQHGLENEQLDRQPLYSKRLRAAAAAELSFFEGKHAGAPEFFRTCAQPNGRCSFPSCSLPCVC